MESRTYRVPNYYSFWDVVFNYNTKEIVILAENANNGTLVLLSCSIAEECKPKELHLGSMKYNNKFCGLFSHPKVQMLLRTGSKLVVI